LDSFTEIAIRITFFGQSLFAATLPAQRFLICSAMKDKLQNEIRELLTRLPDASVSSNFTARVMQAVELEESRSRRKWFFNWNFRPLLPRLAVAATVVICGSLALHEYQLDARRVELAKSVAMVTSSQLPSVDALKNFDTIARMSQQHADEELVALAPEMK
jgi:hypothetical protein